MSVASACPEYRDFANCSVTSQSCPSSNKWDRFAVTQCDIYRKHRFLDCRSRRATGCTRKVFTLSFRKSGISSCRTQAFLSWQYRRERAPVFLAPYRAQQRRGLGWNRRRRKTDRTYRGLQHRRARDSPGSARGHRSQGSLRCPRLDECPERIGTGHDRYAR